MKYKSPLIVVEDISISRRFYEEVLNQKVILNFGANITFEGDFSLQTKQSWADFIHVTGNEVLRESKNFELYFEEERFDEFVERLKSYNVQYVHSVTLYSWGQRAIRFYDPDMHIIEVGEKMEAVVRRFIGQGLSVEETAQRTELPIEFVKAYIIEEKSEKECI